MTNSPSSVRGSRLVDPAPEWAPAWRTRSLSPLSDGPDVADLAAGLLTVPKGIRAGQPLYFTGWQCWLLDNLLERRQDGLLRYRRALVGLGRKNGKSLVGSALAIYGLFMGEHGAEVYSAAGDRQQAKIVFNEAKALIKASPWLSAKARLYRDAIEVPEYGAVYRALSSDAKLQQGLNPSLVVFDELHVQRNADLWDALTLGSGNRLDPLVVAITTAGFDKDSLCGQMYDLGRRIAAGEVEDDSFGFFWWEAPEGCRLDDREAWVRANPNLAEGLLSVEDMAIAARGTTTSESAFRRYRLNQWVRVEESWLPSGAWEAGGVDVVEFDPGLPVWGALDMALKHDSIALVAVQPQPSGDVLSRAQIWTPTKGSTVDIAAVENAIRDLHRRFTLVEQAYDPAYFERSAQTLADEGVNMVEFPQSHARMVPACQTAYEVICTGRLKHDRSPVFTDQVLSAAPKQTDTGWRLSKGRSRRKIDSAIALVMALDRAFARVDADEEVDAGLYTFF